MVWGKATEVARNTTQALLYGVDNPYSRLVRIEVIVSLSTVLQLFLFFFGSSRRRWKSTFLRKCIWMAYTFSHYIILYTMGLMQSAPFKNEMFVMWALFFLYAFGSVNSISAYSLESNQEGKTYAFQGLVQVILVFLLMDEYGSIWLFKVQIYLFWTTGLARTLERWEAFQSASRSSGLVKNTRVVADFMTYEHRLSNTDVINPPLMRGYKYLVNGEAEAAAEAAAEAILSPYIVELKISNEVVTVEKIWECQGRLLTSVGDPDGKLKDICLSFAWFKMLKRRFTGYQLPECGLQKTWDLIEGGFLSNNSSHERAFRVTEVELKFLYDVFFTKYASVCKDGFSILRIFFQIFIIILILVTVVEAIIQLSKYQTPKGHLNHVTKNGNNIDVWITFIVLIVIFTLEILQFIALIISDWAKVFLICEYVNKPTWLLEKVIQFVCRWQLFKPWQRKLGQYSLLESFNYNPWPLPSMITTVFLDWPRKGQKASCSIELPEEVKKAVLCSLQTNGRQLSNGQSSLHRNQMGDSFSWACSLETYTHSILVWHIATSFCEISTSRVQSAERHREEEHHRLVATSLSRYCAYLVAFVPVLLPDHAFTTELIFDSVVKEARKIFEKCWPNTRLYEDMMRMGDGSYAGTIIGNGVKLGKELLEILDEGQIWKVLADYWAEMMLFLAPSDNATAHAENLANGGEFITHLWAFLTHAGILDRNTPQPD